MGSRYISRKPFCIDAVRVDVSVALTLSRVDELLRLAKLHCQTHSYYYDERLMQPQHELLRFDDEKPLSLIGLCTVIACSVSEF